MVKELNFLFKVTRDHCNNKKKYQLSKMLCSKLQTDFVTIFY